MKQNIMTSKSQSDAFAKGSHPILHAETSHRPFNNGIGSLTRMAAHIPVLLLFLCLGTSFSASSQVPTNGLMAYWSFNGGPQDESGNGHDGIVNGATLTSDVFGVPDRAYLFNGTGNHINIGSGVKPSFPFSVLARFKGSFGDLFTNDQQDSNGYRYGIRLALWSNYCQITFYSGFASARTRYSRVTPELAPLEDGMWHSIAVVCRSRTDVDYFVDGQMYVSLYEKGTGGGHIYSASGTGNIAASLPDNSRNNLYFAGAIDDVLVYERALTSDEIMQILPTRTIAWDTIQSPQAVDVPFPVTLAASISGTNDTSFTNAVSLSGYAPGSVSTNLTTGIASNAWAYPLNTFYHDARTQVIYPANEIGLACTINSLALEVITPPGQTLENWTIRMKHTTLTEYSASPEWESNGWTVVYQGNEPAGTTGWRTFEFSTPFDYDGTNNLLIDFSFNNASYSSAGQCQSMFAGAYRSIIYASDSKDGDPLNWSGTNPNPARDIRVPNLMLNASYPDLLPVPISPTVTTPFVNGVWTGEVIVHEAVSNLVLRAEDGVDRKGLSNPFDVLAAPTTFTLVLPDHPFGFTNGCYGFTVQGQSGQVVVIEASTNLITWQPIHTNLMGDLGECLFYDLYTGQYPQRFYRAKLYAGVLPPPLMLNSGAGVVGAEFRVAVGAVGGQEVIVEASTNLVDWTPILTNTATIGPLYFHDPNMTNFNQRFYRAVTP